MDNLTSIFAAGPLDWARRPDASVIFGREDPDFPDSNLREPDVAGELGIARTLDMATTSAYLHWDLGDTVWQRRTVQLVGLARMNLTAGYWRIRADDAQMSPLPVTELLPVGQNNNTGLGHWTNVAISPDDPASDDERVLLAPGQVLALRLDAPASAPATGADRCVIRVRAQAIGAIGARLEIRSRDGGPIDIAGDHAVDTYFPDATAPGEFHVAFDAIDLTDPAASDVRVNISNTATTGGAVAIYAVSWMAETQQDYPADTGWMPMSAAIEGPGDVSPLELPSSEFMASHVFDAPVARRYWLAEFRQYGDDLAVEPRAQPAYVQAAWATLSPLLAGRIYDDQAMRYRAVGGDAEVARDGTEHLALPQRVLREQEVVIRATAAQAFGQLGEGALRNLLLASPFPVVMAPKEAPDLRSHAFPARWAWDDGEATAETRARARAGSDFRAALTLTLKEV